MGKWEGNAVLAGQNPNQPRSTTGGDHSHSVKGGDLEARPANVYVHWIIKVK